MALWQWSKTPSTNQTADATINYSEGQAPSTLNDSARAMMARLAEWRDDIGGNRLTAGTSTAYTIQSSGFLNSANGGVGYNATPAGGSMIAAFLHVTSGSSPTLSVDNGTAFPILTGSLVVPASGTMTINTLIEFVFDAFGSFWIARNFFPTPAAAVTIPVGSIIAYATTTVPTNFLFCGGQSVATANFPSLFAVIAYAFGGSGANFSVPDLRGRAIFGLDNPSGGGGTANRITTGGLNWAGATLGAAGGVQNQTLSSLQMPLHSHGVIDPGHAHNITMSEQANGGAGAFALFPSGTTATASATTGISLGNSGGSQAFTALSPGMSLNFAIRSS